MLVSVIVPIYNTEPYLDICLKSILNQTYRNIEIILVDDGSTDQSIQICIDYAKKDSRIVVIQESHKGLVMARKKGVERAKGEYCIFVDSDDWIAENLLEFVIPLTDDRTVDVVNYGMRSVKGTQFKDWIYTLPEGIYKDQQLEEVYRRMIYDFEKGQPGIIQSLCTKLIRKNILKTCLEMVDSRITMGEDAAVTYSVLLQSEKIVIVNSYLYFYRTHENSMCFSKDGEIFSKTFYFQQYMLSVFSKYGRKYDLEKQMHAYLMSFIKKGLNDFFSLKIRELYHIPFDILEIGKRIVLYGAGNVGRSYYRQLLQNQRIEVVAWIDNSLQNKWIYNCKIESPTILRSINYDKILIAVMNQNVAEEIKTELCPYISESLILWDKPRIYWWEREIDIIERGN